MPLFIAFLGPTESGGGRAALLLSDEDFIPVVQLIEDVLGEHLALGHEVLRLDFVGENQQDGPGVIGLDLGGHLEDAIETAFNV